MREWAINLPMFIKPVELPAPAAFSPTVHWIDAAANVNFSMQQRESGVLSALFGKVAADVRSANQRLVQAQSGSSSTGQDASSYGVSTATKINFTDCKWRIILKCEKPKAAHVVAVAWTMAEAHKDWKFLEVVLFPKVRRNFLDGTGAQTVRIALHWRYTGGQFFLLIQH